MSTSNLKMIRKAANLTQIQLAARAKISHFRLCRAEAGDIELRSDELAAITEALKPEIERTTRLASEFTVANS
jgi:predicted transcriptional regulator